MDPTSTNNPINSKLPSTLIPEKRLTSSLESKIEAIYKHEEIIWKIRAGYLAILYAGLTFLVAQKDVLTALSPNSPINHRAWAMISFLILGFSLSAFIVDLAYLSKRIRIIVIRDMLIDAAYNPGCELKDKDLYMLLQIGSERPLKDHFPPGQEKYVIKMVWNIKWILLPIYALTPLLIFILWLLAYKNSN